MDPRVPATTGGGSRRREDRGSLERVEWGGVAAVGFVSLLPLRGLRRVATGGGEGLGEDGAEPRLYTAPHPRGGDPGPFGGIVPTTIEDCTDYRIGRILGSQGG